MALPAPPTALCSLSVSAQCLAGIARSALAFLGQGKNLTLGKKTAPGPAVPSIPPSPLWPGVLCCKVPGLWESPSWHRAPPALGWDRPWQVKPLAAPGLSCWGCVRAGRAANSPFRAVRWGWMSFGQLRVPESLGGGCGGCCLMVSCLSLVLSSLCSLVEEIPGLAGPWLGQDAQPWGPRGSPELPTPAAVFRIKPRWSHSGACHLCAPAIVLRKTSSSLRIKKIPAAVI